MKIAIIRKLAVLLAAGACALLLGGCTTKNIEAQAYAVTLGVDMTEAEVMKVSVQVPVLGQGGSDGGSGEGDSGGGGKGYTFSAASGQTLTEALEMLNASLTRELNLTGVKSIVIAENLARSEQFGEVFEELALSYRVYGAAEVVVCRGSAADFIQNQQAVIGLRLSESTAVSLAHYRETGFIPSAKAADVYYLSRSVYSDPVAVFASPREEEGVSGEDNAQSYAGEMDQGGKNKNQYFGAAIFSGGRMCGVLNGTQTQLLNLLRGDLKHFSWVVNGVPMRIRVEEGPQAEIILRGERPEIHVRMALSVMDSKGKADTQALRERMLQGLYEITGYAQERASEPFGYAESAARQFLSVEAWRRYDWRTRFAGADVTYEVQVEKKEL